MCVHMCPGIGKKTLGKCNDMSKSIDVREHCVQGALQASCSCHTRRYGVARGAAGRTDYRDPCSFVLMTGSLPCRW